MKYFTRIGMNRATNSAVLTLVRSADSAPLLVDGEPVEVECNYEFVDKCLSLPYLDGLERRIKAIEEDQERLARIEVRDALEYDRLRAKFASREGAGDPRAPACTPREVREALECDGVQSVRVTDDGTRGRVAEVDMGLAGRVTVRIEESDTTETLVARIRLAFWKPRIPCPRCGAREEPEEITIGALDGSTVLRCSPCGMTWRTKETK